MKRLTFLLAAWLVALDVLLAQPAVERIEIETDPPIRLAAAKTRQLNVAALFKDGKRKNVTLIAKYHTSDEETAVVNASGLVEFKKPGEVTIVCRHETHLQAVRLTFVPVVANFRWTDPPQSNFVDKHVHAKLKSVQMAPSDLCGDTDFLRRAYLDLCGIPPTPAEVRKFLADKADDKRAKLIDHLLERPEYADYWAFLWLDALGVTSRHLAAKSRYAYRDWVRAQVVKNTPLDRFAFELLTAQGHSETVGQANFYRIARTPTQAAEDASQVFLGVRLQCVRCHQHPTAQWMPEDYPDLAAFFVGVVRTRVDKKIDAEAIGLDANAEFTHPTTKKPVTPKFPGGIDPKLRPDQDRRDVLARWITSPDNSYFAKTMANRLWQRLFARGIVELPDDSSVPGLAANDELLDALAVELVRGKFDAKHLIRSIMASRTYQLSAAGNDLNKTDTRYFARCYAVPLRKEQLADTVAAVTEMP